MDASRTSWSSWLKAILPAFLLSLVLGEIFEHLFSQDTLAALVRLQEDGERSVSALEPFRLATTYAARFAAPVTEYQACRAAGAEWSDCVSNMSESGSHAVWRRKKDAAMQACLARMPSRSPGRFTLSGEDPDARLRCHGIATEEAGPEPARGQTTSGAGAFGQVLLYPAAVLLGALSDGMPDHSLASIVFLAVQLVIGAGATLVFLIDSGIDWRVRVFLFPIGTVLAASILALPLKLLMLLAIMLLQSINLFASLACQCSVLGVTLWKVAERLTETIAHHGLSAKLH